MKSIIFPSVIDGVHYYKKLEFIEVLIVALITLVIAKMRLKFKRLKQAEKKMIFNTTRLKDTNTRFRYWLKVRNKFSYLEETDDIEVRWSNFKDAVHTAADSIIGWRWSILKEQWRSNKSWILKNKKKQKQIQMRPDSFW